MDLQREGRADISASDQSPPEALETGVDLEKCGEELAAQGGRLSTPTGDTALSPRSSTTAASNSFKSQSSLCCPCCLSSMQSSEEIALLRCGHLYCEACIQSWARRSTQCPVCRASMLASCSDRGAAPCLTP
mmetsp:Transcript_52927/g.99422  ORF Transcript_52927/g.99422 Transcript_52927/m.99422 type:complete len:132 (-) Transcript_52927:283-678(-)